MIAIDLSKQQALDIDPRTIQQINVTANLDRAGIKQCSLLLKKQKSKSFVSAILLTATSLNNLILSV